MASRWSGGGENTRVSTQYFFAQCRKVLFGLLHLDLTCVSTAGCVGYVVVSVNFGTTTVVPCSWAVC